MKKTLLAATLTALAIPATANANCHNIGCLNREVSSLTRQLHGAEHTITRNARALNSFNRCLVENPITLYGDETGGTFGYVYQSSGTTLLTGALAVTLPTSSVGAWFLSDGCNNATSPSIRHAHIAVGAALVPQRLP